MNKKLIYYWYVPTQYYKIYDLHFKCLKYFIPQHNFKEKLFIISYNKGDNNISSSILNIVEKIREVVPDAKFVFYDNNPELREAKYMYNEIMLKLNKFNDDDVLFFAHNKGVDSKYFTSSDVNKWVLLLYYGNLYNVEKIDAFAQNNVQICYGTLFLDWIKNGVETGVNRLGGKQHWNYIGTYYWFKPSLLNDYILKNNIQIPLPNRWFAEDIFGYLMPHDTGLIVKSLGEYTTNIPEYIDMLPNTNKIQYNNLYQQFILNE